MKLPSLTVMQQEVARLIVSALNLEIEPDAIEPDAPLFHEGLGLDSIDALELSLAIFQKYGFQIRSDDPDVQQIFSSLNALSEVIAKNRKV